MKILLYAGAAPSRDSVLQFSVPIVQRCASALTLLSGGGAERQALLDDALRRVAAPPHVAVTLKSLPGNAQAAILAAARAQPYDLVILGRLHQPLGRLLPGAHSKAIAQRLEPSVLRVHASEASADPVACQNCHGGTHAEPQALFATRTPEPKGPVAGDETIAAAVGCPVTTARMRIPWA